jgi:hypothetical protein
MAHEDAGHYAAKHPEGSKSDPQITEAIKQKVTDGKITCAAAHKIAEDFKTSPAKVGMNIDLQEIRLDKCQLGLFGYGKQKKAVKPDGDRLPELEKIIKESVSDDRISCVSCWDIAKKTGHSKLDVSNTCESLNLKISPCQLGTF